MYFVGARFMEKIENKKENFPMYIMVDEQKRCHFCRYCHILCGRYLLYLVSGQLLHVWKSDLSPFNVKYRKFDPYIVFDIYTYYNAYRFRRYVLTRMTIKTSSL